jgi:hypothetical protein
MFFAWGARKKDFEKRLKGDEMFAITDDGKRVELKSDGTWVFASAAAPVADSGFRKARWGMSPAQVQQSEPGANWEIQENLCLFESRLADLSCLVAYIFVGDQLCRGKYIITEAYANDNNYVYSQQHLKEILIKKYGKPDSDEEFWLNDLYQEDPQDWGTAVGAGHMSRYTSWKLPDTDICLSLYGENFECNLAIEYASPQLASVENAQKEADTLDLL